MPTCLVVVRGEFRGCPHSPRSGIGHLSSILERLSVFLHIRHPQITIGIQVPDAQPIGTTIPSVFLKGQRPVHSMCDRYKLPWAF